MKEIDEKLDEVISLLQEIVDELKGKDKEEEDNPEVIYPDEVAGDTE